MNSLIGTFLQDRYRVDAMIGRGGMAEVYKVWDKNRATYLAMKLLREELAHDAVFIRRFRREGQTLSTLQHPNIVRYYGLERINSLVFMLMDFIDGNSLKRVIFEHQGPLQIDQVMQIIRPTCAALQFAHNLRIAHADIKPGNILINKNGQTFVTDFGLAMMIESVTMTLAGAGTPAYMAPEQIKGEIPSPLSDQYSLGVVLYEMVTGGERPFTGELATSTGTLSERVRWEHLNASPPDPARWNPEIPAGFQEVILRMLSKDPALRY